MAEPVNILITEDGSGAIAVSTNMADSPRNRLYLRGLLDLAKEEVGRPADPNKVREAPPGLDLSKLSRVNRSGHH